MPNRRQPTAPERRSHSRRNGSSYGRRSTDRAPVLLEVERFAQPDDVTCGPTCLAQVYRYYGFDKPLPDVIGATARNPDGGTLAVYLGNAALRDGFEATIYSYN